MTGGNICRPSDRHHGACASALLGSLPQSQPRLLGLLGLLGLLRLLKLLVEVIVLPKGIRVIRSVTLSPEVIGVIGVIG